MGESQGVVQSVPQSVTNEIVEASKGAAQQSKSKDSVSWSHNDVSCVHVQIKRRVGRPGWNERNHCDHQGRNAKEFRAHSRGPSRICSVDETAKGSLIGC